MVPLFSDFYRLFLRNETDGIMILDLRIKEKVMNFREIMRIFIHFACFGFSFYALSGLDLGRIMLNTPEKSAKGQVLLILLSLGLGYVVAQFILSIMYQL